MKKQVFQPCTGRRFSFCQDRRQTNVSYQPKNNCCAKTRKSAMPPRASSSGVQSSLSNWHRSSEKETLDIAWWFSSPAIRFALYDFKNNDNVTKASFKIAWNIGSSSVVQCPPLNSKVGCSIHCHWVNCRSDPWIRAFTSTAPARSAIQASACRKLPWPKLIKNFTRYAKSFGGGMAPWPRLAIRLWTYPHCAVIYKNNPKFSNFWKSKLQDFPHLLRVWSVLWLKRSACHGWTKSLAL